MRITEIHLEGQATNFAVIRRKRCSAYIDVAIITPTGTRAHHVLANDRDDQFSMAECLQEMLDGHRGTNSMVHEYFNIIARFAS